MRENQRVRKVERQVVEVRKNCLVCERYFWGIKKAKYCSGPCGDKAYRASHARELAEKQAGYYRARKAAKG